MDWKLEVVCVPVSEVDRAKAFYAEQAGFRIDYDSTFTEEYRVVQLTPPGSGCSIVIGGVVRAPCVAADARAHGAGLTERSATGRSRRRGCSYRADRQRCGCERHPTLRERRLDGRARRGLELIRLFQRSGRQRVGHAGKSRVVGFRRTFDVGARQAVLI